LAETGLKKVEKSGWKTIKSGWKSKKSGLKRLKKSQRAFSSAKG
jgi:hypothetical protein